MRESARLCVSLMTVLDSRLLLLATIPAKPLNLNHLTNCCEAEHRCLFTDEGVDLGIVQLGNGAALATDQELSRMGTAGVTTTYKGIERIQAVHQVCFNQEFEGPVDRWRRGSAALAI